MNSEGFNESIAYRKNAFHTIFNSTDRWVWLITFGPLNRVTEQEMPSYEVRQCEGSSHERWCIYVNGACDHSLGEFNSRAEAETKVRQLILREKVLAINPSAKFEIPLPAHNRTYIGSVLAVIDPSEGFGCGVAQSSGRGLYALHTGKAFAAVVPQSTSTTVEYRGGEIKVEFPKAKERGGNER